MLNYFNILMEKFTLLITGGTGSGKSTLCKSLADSNYNVKILEAPGIFIPEPDILQYMGRFLQGHSETYNHPHYVLEKKDVILFLWSATSSRWLESDDLILTSIAKAKCRV